MCPAGEGAFFPGSLSDVMSDMKLARYGVNVKSDAIKYAMTHLRMLRCKFEIAGRRLGEYHGSGAGSRNDRLEVLEMSESSESYSSASCNNSPGSTLNSASTGDCTRLSESPIIKEGLLLWFEVEGITRRDEIRCSFRASLSCSSCSINWPKTDHCPSGDCTARPDFKTCSVSVASKRTGNLCA